jgi:hypothetical protein
MAVDIGVNPIRPVISRAAMQQIVRFTFWSGLPYGCRGVRLQIAGLEIGNSDLCLTVFQFDRDGGSPLFAGTIADALWRAQRRLARCSS